MTVERASRVRIAVATAASAGAVALIQLHGAGASALAAAMCGHVTPTAQLKRCDFAGIDTGLVVALRDDWVQLMPHGGPRVVQKVVDRLVELGGTIHDDLPAAELYPEARSLIEADVLTAIARAASPAAIDALAAQPARWRAVNAEAHGRPKNDAGALRDALEATPRLDRLLQPPTIVVIGRPNVGKSTLTNAMLGRAVSIVADLPGTTRDWVAGLAELAPVGAPQRAVAVRWLDTPGLRESSDTIEQEAIALARRVVAEADVLIAMRDPRIDWPEPASLPREPDLWVVNKVDQPGGQTADANSPDHPLQISAANDRGLDRLAHLVLARLGLDALDTAPLWAFSPTLRSLLRGDPVDLAAYVRDRS